MDTATATDPSNEVVHESVVQEVNEPLDTFPIECPEGEHRIQTPWSWWFDTKLKSSDGKISPDAFRANLKHVGTVHSIEQFAKYYHSLKKPTEMPVDSNLHLMRYNTPPMWEPFPLGGCWLIKISSKNQNPDEEGPGSPNWMWERLLFAAIGENFATPDMIGVSLSIRKSGTIISIWNLNEMDNQSTRLAIGERIKELVQLPHSATIEYKYHGISMKDRSSFKNARPYLIVAATETKTAPVMELPPAAAQSDTQNQTSSGATETPASAAWSEMAATPKTSSPTKPETNEAEPVAIPVEDDSNPEPEASAPAAPAERSQPAKLSFAEMAKRNAANGK